MTELARRRVLKGMLNGGVVTVGLPLLNCFLNGNGTALASGTPIPVRFGTWFWGCGINKAVFVPKKIGTGFDLPKEISSLKAVREKINLVTNLTAFKDQYPLQCHGTGWVVSRTGMAPPPGVRPGVTIDVSIANQIGRLTRFKLLTCSASGDARDSFSYENGTTTNAAEISPLKFYSRLFGPEFQDPNAPNFTPSPRDMARKSALSVVLNEIKTLKGKVGAEDTARLDQYFTGLRQLELQLEHRLEKPLPLPACRPGKAPEDTTPGTDAELVATRHRLLTDLMVMAVACDQTRVFNMAYAAAGPLTSQIGYDRPHHTCTHEERIDDELGYQLHASWFTERAMESWAYFVDAFSKIKEGDGTLLDNVLIYATTEVGFARIHSLDGMPAFTAGRAGGRMKTGLHVAGAGTSIARLGYTAMRVMGVDVSSWGTLSNTTSQEFGEILS